MRKNAVSKLKLNRETLHGLGYVTGSVSAETMCGYTCLRQCRPVPSVDECGGSNPVGTCASLPYGCETGVCITHPANGCPVW